MDRSLPGKPAPTPDRKWLARLLAGLWFAAFSAAAFSILTALAYCAVAQTVKLAAGELVRMRVPVLWWGGMSSSAFGIAGAWRGWRLFRDPVADSDAFRNGAGIGAAASAFLFPVRVMLLGGPQAWPLGLHLLVSHVVLTLGLAAAIGAFGGWSLLRLRLAAGK